MKTKILILVCALLGIAATINIVLKHLGLPLAKVTVKVVDENQQPIENAKISLGYGYTADVGVGLASIWWTALG